MNPTKQQDLYNRLYTALMPSTELKNERFIVIVMNQCKMMEKLPEIAEINKNGIFSQESLTVKDKLGSRINNQP